MDSLQYVTYSSGTQSLDMLGKGLISPINNLGCLLCLLSVSKTSQETIPYLFCFFCFSTGQRLLSEGHAQSSLTGHVTSGRLRLQHPWEAPWSVYRTGLERELWLIAHNSCVLIMCVSGFCVSKIDPMTKIHFIDVRIIQWSREKCTLIYPIIFSLLRYFS